MKHIYNPLNSLTLFFLFFTFTISSSDYYQPINNTPNIRINVNPAQSSPKSSFHYGFRNTYAPHYNHSTKTNTHTSEDTPLSIHHNIGNLPCISDAIKQRNTTLEQFIHNNPESHRVYFKKYFITETTKRYLSSHNIDVSTFESCEGNQLQGVEE